MRTLHTTSAPFGPLLELDGAYRVIDGCWRHWGGGLMSRMPWPRTSNACGCPVPRVKLTMHKASTPGVLSVYACSPYSAASLCCALLLCWDRPDLTFIEGERVAVQLDARCRANGHRECGRTLGPEPHGDTQRQMHAGCGIASMSPVINGKGLHLHGQTPQCS